MTDAKPELARPDAEAELAGLDGEAELAGLDGEAELARLDAELSAAATRAERAYRDWISADSAFQAGLRNRQPVADRLRANAARAAAGPTPPDQLGAASPSLAVVADANELEQIDQRLAEMAATATHAYEACRNAAGDYRAMLPQRELVASRLSAAGGSPLAAPTLGVPPLRTPTLGGPRLPPFPPPPMPRPPGQAPPGLAPIADRPETSGHTVQNVLFVLGGLLLGAAAIVFTAVAWATFGDAGRAAVLGTVTALFLAVPPLALRRGLRATAETFAGIGLLLVVLDGYAAWYVNLFHAKDLPAQRYVALVCTITAAFGLGYRRLTRLGAPVIASLVAIQPAVPLWVASAYQLDPDGWVLVWTAVAAINLATVVIWRRPGLTLFSPGFATAVRALAWVAFAVALATATDTALIAEALARSTSDVAVAGGAVMLVVATLTTAAALTRSTSFHAIAGCVLVLAFLAALARLVGVARPEHSLWIDAAAVALTALLVALAVRPLRRSRWNPGGPLGLNTGVGFALATLWTVLAVLALATAARTADAALPAWRADLGPIAAPDQQLLAAVLVATLAAAVRFWAHRRMVLTVGANAAVFALPGALDLPWWAPSTLDFVAVTTIVVASLLATGPTNRSTSLQRHPARLLEASAAAISAALLTVHAITTSLARPALTAAILAGMSAVGVASVVATRWLPAAAHRLAWAGGAFAVGLITAPPALGSLAAAIDQPVWWQARLTMVGLAGTVLLLALLRSSPGGVLWCGYVAVLVGALVWPDIVALGDAEPAGTYAGLGLVVVASALLLLPRQLPASVPGLAEILAAVAAAPATILAATSTVPAVAAITLAPYFWLASIWTGPPTGIGLAPDNVNLIDISYVDAVTLALIGVAAAIVGYVRTRRAGSIVTGLGVGVPAGALVAIAAAGPVWPGVAGATLGLGLGLTVLAGVRRLGPGLTTVAAGQGFGYVLAGLAGMLPTQWTTLAGLGATTVAAAIVVALGRGIGARASAAIVAVTSALTTAAAAGAAADLRREQVAFIMLAVATLALTAGVALSRRHRAVSLAIQASAQAGAVVSVLFTIPTLASMAIACTAWGVVVGLHALWPSTARTVRIGRAAQAAGWELLAWWLLLADNNQTTVEFYTLPLAGVGMLAGWAALRARPDLRSWLAYGPALAAALLPSLAIVLAATPQGGSGEPMRRLLLGAGALAAVIGGSVRRRQAPVVIGGVVLIIVALHEVQLYWDLVPRWIPLAAGGAILIGFAITYERRRRDMTRLRDAIGRMR